MPSGDAATAALIRKRQIQAVATVFLRRRPLIVAPAAVLLWILLRAAGVPPAQLLAVAAVNVALIAFFSWEAWRYRTREISTTGFAASLAITLVGIAVACALTGRLRSPLVPLLFAPSVLGVAAFGLGVAGRLLLGLLLGAGLALVALPRSAAFPVVPPPVDGAATLATIVVTMALVTVGIAGLVLAYERTGYALGQLRAEVAADSEARPRELAALGARLAHELRNPLAALKGLLQLEARHAEGERAQRRFAVMEGEAARLEQILSEYLTFARPPADPRTESVPARPLLREVLAVLEGKAYQAGVTLDDEGEDLRVLADPQLLKQALFNLFANALEATPAGGRVTGRVRRCPEGACLDVVDTGRGMTPEVAARLGTPFFSTRAAGTGLGVVLAQRIARQHGGDLRFASRPGAGTTATLILPAAAEQVPA